ncbi:MAG: hypothetical protein K2G44_03965 [Clostridia bacterium]|nr:hypothetical protein [Clostridia bacterium]
MDKNFEKFKKRVWRDIFIKCVLIGLASALFTVDVVLLPCKLCGVSLLWVYYLLIGLGAAAIGGAIAFLLLRTNDKKIARRMDRELKLEERVVTSLEFSGQESEMLEIQRENTSSVLLGISTWALSIGNIIAIALSAVGMAVGVAAIPIITEVVPTVVAETTEPVDPIDPDRPITDWEETALDSLIQYVRDSKKADARTKSGMLYELEGLRDLLLSGVSESNFKVFVQNSVNNIRNLVKDANAVDGVSEEQQQLNTQESNYVIDKLYEIFKLESPGGENPDDGNKEDPEDPEDPDKKPTLPPPLISGNQLPIFVPEKGQVVFDDEVADEFFNLVQQKYDDGEITQEEFEYYFEYFNALRKKDDNN